MLGTLEGNTCRLLCIGQSCSWQSLMCAVMPLSYSTACGLASVSVAAHKMPGDVLHVCLQAIPAFLTIAVMPLTYSIAYGVVAGLVAYIIINGVNWLLDNLWSGAKSLPQWAAHVRQVSPACTCAVL